MRLAEKIHLLKHDFEILLGPGKKISRYVNSLVVFGEEITLIDSGVKTSIDNIFSYIRQNQRDPSEISTLILSHSHPDHIGSAMKIKKMTGCRIMAHEAEKDWMEDIELQQRQRPVPGFLNLADESVILDGFLHQDQELLADENVTLRILHSPGHSRGSLNIQFIEDKILFTADSIPVMNDIPNYEDFRDLIKSLSTIHGNRDFEILITSWTSPLSERDKIIHLLKDAERYLRQLDESVRHIYTGIEITPLECCSNVIKELGLPEFYINPIVDKAFRTHLR